MEFILERRERRGEEASHHPRVEERGALLGLTACTYDAARGQLSPPAQAEFALYHYRMTGWQAHTYRGFVRDTCIKWSQDVSGLKIVAYQGAFLHQCNLKFVVS